MKITEGRVRLAASDVANFLACQRLTQLDLLRARGELRAPREFDIGFQELVRRGEVHELSVLERFRTDGLEVVEISAAEDFRGGAAATAEAIQAGAGVIYQGTLTGDGPGTALFGRPDFLVRADRLPAPDGEPRPGGIHYEVVDAKLARSAKARAVLQTSFYSHLLADLQGTEPRWMHLALGNGEFVPFKVNDCAAYERQTRRLLEAAIGGAPNNPAAEVYPEPVEHCAICRWRELCAGRRRTDDDLSLVAGMTTGQRRALKGAGIPTRRGFAGRADLPRLDRVSGDALARAQLQARLQVASEDAGVTRYELLDPERDSDGALVANRGLLALPEPADGDLFFDIEGARYYSEDGREFGLQYLFGVVDTADAEEAGLPRYTQIWAYDRAGEKRAFEELIDFITERRARHPGLHVYHYNHYEPTSVDHLTELHGTRQEAVGRLMGRFATREDEVDDLFRLGVFVDLYRVVRQGVRAGVESYSIKRLEPLCGYARQVDLHEATVNLIALEAALEDGTAAGDRERQRVVAGYNEDDCRATLALRDWLEDRRAELAGRLGRDLPRPVFAEKPGAAEDPEVVRIRSALLAGVPAETPLSNTERTDSERARVLLADLLDWHRRDDKPAWWRHFYLRTLSPAELIGEPDALGGLAGGEKVGQVKKSVVRRFFVPPQEHKFSTGEVACDPDTNKQWTVCDVDDARGTIDLKMGSGYAGPWPAALVEAGPPRTREQRDRLRDLGERVVRDGVGGGDAATALLLRRPPDDGGARGTAAARAEDETAQAAAVRLAVSLRRSYLPMQGPPGTGKTHTAAEQILEVIAHGRTVGITGPSHAVICHLIDTVYEHARWRGARPRIGQRAERDNPHLHADAAMMSNEQLERALRDGELDVAAGTTWLWARAGMAGRVDTLFVDEAGQLSLAGVLAVAGAARNLILLGDPQQLAQPSHATHPPGAGASALEHILGDRATMPAGAGLLLDQTWRMHPDLCEYTSAAFYDGKLHGVDGLDRQEIVGFGAGLRVVGVPHQGNTNALQRAKRPPGRRPAGAEAPYRGLARFERKDARWFFGREDVTDLLAAWPRLRSWIEGGLEHLLTGRRVAEAARAWGDAGRESAALWRGSQLAAARGWASDEDNPASPGTLAGDFIAASIAAEQEHQRAERRRARRLQRLVAALAVMVVAVGTLAGFAFQQRQQATTARDDANSRETAVEAGQVRGQDEPLAAQLSVAAYNTADTLQATASLLESSGSPAAARLLDSAGLVQSVSVSPDRGLLAVAAADGTLRLWDVTSPGHPVQVGAPLAQASDSPLYATSFSPDGQILAAAGAGRVVELWDVSRPGHPVRLGTLTGPANTVYSVAFSPDGTAVAAGTSDASVLVWNLATRSLTATLPHPQPVTSLAWDGTGRLAAGDADGTVSLWTLPTPVLLTGNAPSGVAYSPDGATLAVGGQNVQLWNAIRRTLIATRPLPAGTITNGIAYSPAGTMIAIARSDGTAWLLDTRTLRPAGPPFRVTATGNAESKAFSPDGKLLATAGDDGTVRLWSLADPARPRELASVHIAWPDWSAPGLLAGGRHHGSFGACSGHPDR